jgi:hypothetical protein
MTNIFKRGNMGTESDIRRKAMCILPDVGCEDIEREDFICS